MVQKKWNKNTKARVRESDLINRFIYYILYIERKCQMTQLFKGMYGNHFDPKAALFDLYSGQMRGGKTKMTHNSGWYNKSGEKLGWGDLSVGDFKRISREINKTELFIILSERDSFWNFVTHIGAVGCMCQTNPAEKAPGVNYVVEHARYVIARKKFYIVDRYGYKKKSTLELNGLCFTVLKFDAFKTFINTGVLA